jgi:hypothetical protein
MSDRVRCWEGKTLKNRISIRGKLVGAGAVATVTAGTIGLNVTGAVGDLTPSLANESSSVTATAFVRDDGVDRSAVAAGKRTADAALKYRKAQAAKKRAKQKAAAARAAAARRAKQRAASRSAAQRDPRGIARSMASARYGWGAGEFSCLNSLWQKESGWNYRASNSSSGAYGIPQALPGSKMSSKGGDWRTNPATQIAWGLSYIKSSYGSPCAAWQKSRSVGWY